MSGIADIADRIAQIQTMLGVGVPTSTRTGATASANGFAAALASAQDRTAPSAAVSAHGKTGADVVADAKKYLGIPYVFGSTDPSKGLDCSSLVQRVYADLGVDLPRLVRHQRFEGQPVPSLAQAKPGDLLVFDGYQHIGIYIGDGKMIHAPQPGEKVKIGKVYETPTSIRRILPEATTATSPVTGPLLRPTALAATGSRAVAALPYGNLFVAAGGKHGISPALLAAVAKVESGYNARAVSPAGARGLMQIMPGTAAGLGVDPFNPAQAADGAARLLKRNLTDFNGSLPLALAAYNAGAGAVRRYGGIPPYAETQAYVKKVQSALAGIN